MEQQMVNGVDVRALGEKISAIRHEPELGKFMFHVNNQWLEGGHSKTQIDSFYGTRQEHPHRRSFELEAAEPPVLLGGDEGPNPVEHLLNALVTCLTGAMVYHAAARGIHIEEIESEVEGDLDVRGFMGISPDVRKGYENIRVRFNVKSQGSPEELEECARYSPVLDVVSRGTKVDLQIQKKA